MFLTSNEMIKHRVHELVLIRVRKEVLNDGRTAYPFNGNLQLYFASKQIDSEVMNGSLCAVGYLH